MRAKYIIGQEFKPDYRRECQNIYRHKWENNQCTVCGLKRQYMFNQTIYTTGSGITYKRGHNISDDKLTEVAKAMKLKPKVLIKNYKSVVSINEIVGSLNAL